eukprot:616968-Rhodomonas_salina.1
MGLLVIDLTGGAADSDQGISEEFCVSTIACCHTRPDPAGSAELCLPFAEFAFYLFSKKEALKSEFLLGAIAGSPSGAGSSSLRSLCRHDHRTSLGELPGGDVDLGHLELFLLQEDGHEHCTDRTPPSAHHLEMHQHDTYASTTPTTVISDATLPPLCPSHADVGASCSSWIALALPITQITPAQDIVPGSTRAIVEWGRIPRVPSVSLRKEHRASAVSTWHVASPAARRAKPHQHLSATQHQSPETTRVSWVLRQPKTLNPKP